MSVLLCLLSDQHVPNLLSVHHYKPDRLVLIETVQMKSRGAARHFLTALKIGGLDYDARHHVEPLNAEDNLDSVRQVLQAAYGKHPTDQWTANLTGGTKPMSIATYEFFKELGGNLVYTNVASPSRIINITGNCTDTCAHRPGIKEFLAGYGFESRKADAKLEEAETRAREWVRSAILLARHASEKDVLALDDDEWEQARKKGIELPVELFTVPCDELHEIWFGTQTRVSDISGLRRACLPVSGVILVSVQFLQTSW